MHSTWIYFADIWLEKGFHTLREEIIAKEKIAELKIAN